MAHVTGSILIDRPIEVVFDYVADQTREPEYNPEMLSSVRLTDGPIGVGTKFHAVMRSEKRELPMDIEVTEYQRPHRIVSHTDVKPMAIDGAVSFEAIGSATRMTWDWDVQTHGLLRLAGPMITRIGRKQEERIWEGLKTRLESMPST